MKDFNLILTEEEIKYYEDLKYEQLIEDIAEVVSLIDSLNIDDHDVVYELN